MIMRFFITTLAFLAVSFIPMASLQAAQAPLTDAKVTSIRQNCLSAQVLLQRIQRSDAATRINRGQTYEVVLNKLMSPLNGRLAFHRFSEAATFTDTAKKFEQTVDKFKQDYDDYDTLLSKVLKIKCQDQPVTFYDTLTAAREKRALVAQDIDEIKKVLQEYQNLVTSLQKNLPANHESASGE